MNPGEEAEIAAEQAKIDKTDFRLLLIQEVRAYPGVWDKCDPNFKDRNKGKVWVKISEEVSKKLKTFYTPQKCKFSWKVLYDSLRSARKRLQEDRLINGPENIRLPTWEFWHPMSYVRAQMDKYDSLAASRVARLNSMHPGLMFVKEEENNQPQQNGDEVTYNDDVNDTIHASQLFSSFTNMPAQSSSPASNDNDEEMTYMPTTEPGWKSTIMNAIQPFKSTPFAVEQPQKQTNHEENGLRSDEINAKLEILENAINVVENFSTTTQKLITKSEELLKKEMTRREDVDVSATAVYIDAKIKEFRGKDKAFASKIEGKLMQVILEAQQEFTTLM